MLKKILLAGLLIILSGEISLAKCSGKTEFANVQEAMRYKKFVEYVQQERAVIYNALNLDEEQVQFKEFLLLQNNPIYEEKLKEFVKQSYKLQALEKVDACEFEIFKQKRIVQKIRNDIEKLLNDENKCFKKVLNHEQRSKYSMIRKLERRDFRRALHQKDYYKSNPQMQAFGNPCQFYAPVESAKN